MLWVPQTFVLTCLSSVLIREVQKQLLCWQQGAVLGGCWLPLLVFSSLQSHALLVLIISSAWCLLAQVLWPGWHERRSDGLHSFTFWCMTIQHVKVSNSGMMLPRCVSPDPWWGRAEPHHGLPELLCFQNMSFGSPKVSLLYLHAHCHSPAV